MRARALFGLVAITTLVVAGPAWAKVDIENATVTGPGLGGGLHIQAPNTRGLWGSGIDMTSGLHHPRPDSVEGLGLTHADLGSRYVVIYRFTFSDDAIHQDLYPYAQGGPVTYIAPDQELSTSETAPAFVGNMSTVPGWYRGSAAFLGYLIADHGFPEDDPVAAVVGREPDPSSGFRFGPWAGIIVVAAGIASISLGVTAARRRRFARIFSLPRKGRFQP